MNSANENAGRQLQDVQHWAEGELAVKWGKGEFAVGQQLPWTRCEAKRFQDQRCPVCGALGCGGCWWSV